MGPRCLPTLGTARLLGSSYLQSRELPLTPSGALTLYDPVKAPSWPHGQRGPTRGAQELGLPGCRPRATGLFGEARVPAEPTHAQLEVTPWSPPRPPRLPRCCRARRPAGTGTPPEAGLLEPRTMPAGRDCPTCDRMSDREKGTLSGQGEAAGQCTPSEHCPPGRPPQLWPRATRRSAQDAEPTTCARNAQGREGLRCPSIYRGAVCCYSNGGISDEWGRLFLPLSRLQKETKTPFTSANNALMWAPAPRSPHKPGSVRAAHRHTGLWGPRPAAPAPRG